MYFRDGPSKLGLPVGVKHGRVIERAARMMSFLEYNLRLPLADSADAAQLGKRAADVQDALALARRQGRSRDVLARDVIERNSSRIQEGLRYDRA
jgi:hypothetical protein